jgi:hypothetical protein
MRRNSQFIQDDKPLREVEDISGQVLQNFMLHPFDPNLH